MNSNVDRIPKKFIGAVEDEWQLYSDRSSDYTRGLPIGYGASSTVYAAHYNPPGGKPIPCALKVLDLDSLPQRTLALLNRETQLMSLSKHPNVLRVRGTWVDGHKLYIAMRLMNKGSAADVMRYGWPGGMEEDVVKCILKQGLEGLNYLHTNELIHRDVKAANLLIDDDGTVLLGDLGVAASLVDDQPKVTSPTRRINFETSFTVPHTTRPSAPYTRPKIGKRKSFVGTPCWMAPEVIQGKQYDSSADIWSFGITALELSQGRPPHSRDAPHTVLLQTVQGAPPTVDRTGGQHKYSRAFKEIVESCLVKDPSKRPTAAQLLQDPFFKSAKKKYFLVNAILNGLPPLQQRQERRGRPASIVHGTIDSWDFSLTTTSFKRPGYLRRLSSGKSIGSNSPISATEGVFDFEAEIDKAAGILSSVDGVDEAKEDAVLPSDPLDSEDEALSPPEVSSPSTSASSSPSGVTSASSSTSTTPAVKTAAEGSTAVFIPGHNRINLGKSLKPTPSPERGNPSSAPTHSSSSSSPSLWRKLTGQPDSTGHDKPLRKGLMSRKSNNSPRP